jgi:glycosyltransferase involved in cell wall biosynthesis
VHVAVNALFWCQPMVGSGQYLHGLLRGLLHVAPQHQYTLLLPADANSSGLGASPSPWRAAPEFVAHRLAFLDVPTPFDRRSKNLAKLWFEQVGAPLAAGRIGADVLHVPYFAPPLRCAVPVVTTVGDIIPLRLPEYAGGPQVHAYMALVRRAVRASAEVLTFSAFSRDDIITYLGLPREHVTPVLLAADEQYRPLDQAEAQAQVAVRFGLRAPFVYYVGGLDARKNVPLLVRAFGRLRRAGGPQATLVIAGRALGGDPDLFPDIDAIIGEQRLGVWVKRIDVSRSDNPLLYAAATVFAFPSRYEGFGLPPLEAMACGTPAVVAAASSLPEVVGDAALLVSPDDEAGWAEALWRLLADGRLCDELRARGLHRAAQFSNERTARETLAIYQRAMRRSPA